jgi:dienelactone hydrolase
MCFKKYFTIILFAFIKTGSFAQDVQDTYLSKSGFTKVSIKAQNDTIVFITSNNDKKKPKPTVLFLQGSLPLPIVFYNQSVTKTILPFDIKPYSDKFNFVVIARKGIPLVGSFDKDANGYLDKNGKVPNLYIANDNLKYREYQAKIVLDFLYKQGWVKKDSIFVVGHSEGYRIAAKLSENNEKIAKLVCMSANPFNRTVEDIFKKRMKCFSSNKDSIAQAQIDISIENYKNIGDNIEEYKKDSELYNWMSYNSELSYGSLLKFSNPILVTYGTDDTGSLQNDLLPFLLPKKNLTLTAYPDLDHNYFKKEFDKDGKPMEDSYHWDEVFKDIVNWLLSK